MTTPVPPEAVKAAAEAMNDTRRGWNKPAYWWSQEIAQAILEAAAPVLHDHWAASLRRDVERMRNKARALAATQTAPELMLGFGAQDEVLTAVLRLIGGAE